MEKAISVYFRITQQYNFGQRSELSCWVFFPPKDVKQLRVIIFCRSINPRNISSYPSSIFKIKEHNFLLTLTPGWIAISLIFTQQCSYYYYCSFYKLNFATHFFNIKNPGIFLFAGKEGGHFAFLLFSLFSLYTLL